MFFSESASELGRRWSGGQRNDCAPASRSLPIRHEGMMRDWDFLEECLSSGFDDPSAA